MDSLKEELNKSPEFTQLKVVSKSTLEPFDVNKYPDPPDKTEKEFERTTRNWRKSYQVG